MLVNGMTGEILSLQSLSETQRSLENHLNQKIERQSRELKFMRVCLSC